MTHFSSLLRLVYMAIVNKLIWLTNHIPTRSTHSLLPMYTSVSPRSSKPKPHCTHVIVYLSLCFWQHYYFVYGKLILGHLFIVCVFLSDTFLSHLRIIFWRCPSVVFHIFWTIAHSLQEDMTSSLLCCYLIDACCCLPGWIWILLQTRICQELVTMLIAKWNKEECKPTYQWLL